MENTNQQDQEDKTPLTPEQILERRTTMLKFYAEQLPLLEAQKTNETFIADIEEARLRRIKAQMHQAHLLAPNIDPKEDPKTVKEDSKDCDGTPGPTNL